MSCSLIHNHKQRFNVPLSPAAVAFDTEHIGHVGNTKVHSEFVEQVQMVNELAEGTVLLYYAMGSIFLAWFRSICPVRGKGHCRAIKR